MYSCHKALSYSTKSETMASSKQSLFLLVLVHGLLFLSYPVFCKKEEEVLFQGINSFRQSLNLSSLRRNGNATCLAGELAVELGNPPEDNPCYRADDFPIGPGNGPKFPNFNKTAHNCQINNKTTTDGVILPVWVANWNPDLLLHNYTKTQYAKFLNDSKYTGAGVGSDQVDWMIVVLTTDTQSGIFSGASALGAIAMVHYIVVLLLGLFLVLL